MSVCCIWQPKYSTKEVLIATNKVGNGKNYVFFAGDRNWKDLYSYDGEKVRKYCKISTNGKIYCFCIPLSWLVSEGDLPTEYQLQRDKEYENFKKKYSKKG